MRYRPLMTATTMALSLLGGALPTAHAAVSVGVGIHAPGVSIGINFPLFPDLVQVPDQPVYYAPQVNANYFFFDGLYWVYAHDTWYSSSWYNGPWVIVQPAYVPVYVLRVPVRYYRVRPVYFAGWRDDGPPRWDRHWGPQWHARNRDWDRWDRRNVPPPAPLPVYQREYSGPRYPTVEQQVDIRVRNYHYEPKTVYVRERVAAEERRSELRRDDRGDDRDRDERKDDRQDDRKAEARPERKAEQRSEQKAEPKVEKKAIERHADRDADRKADRKAEGPAPRRDDRGERNVVTRDDRTAARPPERKSSPPAERQAMPERRTQPVQPVAMAERGNPGERVRREQAAERVQRAQPEERVQREVRNERAVAREEREERPQRERRGDREPERRGP